MRLAFMGTPDFAVKALAELVAAGHEVVCVYSQPPAPKGRGQVLTPSPVHAFADSLGLLVRTPKSMKSPDAIAEFQALDIDAAIVVAYGQILKREVLEHPLLGCFNLHASLLPRWRGAAPIQRAIMAGDTHTGVQVMRMSEGLDEGPVILSGRVEIGAQDTAQTLHDKLAGLGASLLPVALAAIERSQPEGEPQVGEVTYAKKITSEEARIDWSRSARELDWHIRGLSPFPGAWTTLTTPKGEQRLKVLMSRVDEAVTDAGPGTLIGPGLRLATGDGVIELLRVQREGKAAQEAAEFLNGVGLSVGDRLG
ncbi:methionyl-tRNA formyltransferase [Asticcacaulis excentricus]|uniref:Methionyl-tRNA formyltransferase n=1 Tax=Asticcacaulis excentricus (strain ATCC 15261 / DSM 4724 / KCTC 12464 / NCIMB 9791 / VKM B-1370 / CB 48) TaxID=573065 RepID=E8RL84_ASTEC|nr:methionyl-tRNA formyltransferase [Asticcacaulis excentricus]ADU12574.1 methionyl-tRNA formyltransferase [Asticcacaulis excentricus CB 48]